MISRRGFTTGLLSLIAAPVVVKASVLMPIRGYNLAIVPSWCPAGWMPCVGQTIERGQFPQLFEALQIDGRRFIPLFFGKKKATLYDGSMVSYFARDLIDPPTYATSLQKPPLLPKYKSMDEFRVVPIIATEAHQWRYDCISPAGFYSTMTVSQSQFEEYYGTAS